MNHVKEWFLNLLEYLKLVARISEPNALDIKYFMPSLLTDCDPIDLKDLFDVSYGNSKINSNHQISPCLVQFTLKGAHTEKAGGFPRGLFCCLIAVLIQRKSEYQWYIQDGQEELFMNVATFLIGTDNCYVTLIDRILYLEIQIRSHQSVAISACCKAKSIIHATLDEIGKELFLYDCELLYGFLCQCQFPNMEEQHLTFWNQNCKAFICQRKKPTPPEPSFMVWFDGAIDPKGMY